MKSRQKYLLFWMIFLSAWIVGLYAIAHTPIPRPDLVAWALIFFAWWAGQKRTAFATWRSDLQSIYKVSLYGLFLLAFAYFLVRAFASAPAATLVTLVLFGYFALFQYVGPLLVLNKRLDDAQRYVDLMRRIFPRSTNLALQQVYTYSAQNKLEEAIDTASEVIDTYQRAKHKTRKVPSRPSQTQIQAYAARLMAEIGLLDATRALPDAEWLIRANPNDPTAYIHRATALMYADNPEAAQADLDHVFTMPLTPVQRFVAEHNNGTLAYRNKDYSQALSYYIKASQIPLSIRDREEYLPIVYASMGRLHLDQGDHQAAWQAVRTANEINPTSPSAQISLAVLHASEGEWKQAVRLWRDLAAKNAYLANREYMARYYQSAPRIADLAAQILDRLDSPTV